MKTDRSRLFNWILVGCAFVATLVVYARLPERVPTHWNLSGQADGFTSKPFGPFVLPLVMALLALLTSASPRLSPVGFLMDTFAPVFRFVRTAALLLAFILHICGLLFALGVPVPITRVGAIGLGLYAVVAGNYMAKLTGNFFIGYRTPWTLTDPEVWNRTHRLGGRGLVLAGLVLIASGTAGWGLGWALGVLAVAAVAPPVYSYVLWRKNQPTQVPRHQD